MILGMFNRDGKKVAEFNPDDGVLMIPSDDLRDKFAMKFMGGIVSTLGGSEGLRISVIAKDAYLMADAMMEARKS